MIMDFKLFLTTWSVGMLFIIFLQLSGGGIPGYQNIYFYIGYFSAPVLFSFFTTYIFYVVKRKKLKKNNGNFDEENNFSI